jgi:uncharacterized membrane protein YdjX (TVP38/TMEM64 family)
MNEHRLSARRFWWLPALAAAGLLLAFWQPVSLADLLRWGDRAADAPGFLAAVVVVIALLFAFGLPGSLGLWLIAPFHPPIPSTALLVLASVAGAFGAYVVSARWRRGLRPTDTGSRVTGLLRRRSDLATQVALRMLPGFPHSVVNFAAGALQLPLPTFTLAAVLGLTVKWGVYSSAVHGLADAVETGGSIRGETLIPLLVLAILMLIGGWLRHRLSR